MVMIKTNLKVFWAVTALEKQLPLYHGSSFLTTLLNIMIIFLKAWEKLSIIGIIVLNGTDYRY